ncbi:division/cell wall cluster transcriptional repressor MraZ [bacterium]|nr:division/cell wall cluster transcriptional repressor MraZ [candidate division CSSED10-310 bacterium]
MTGLTGITRKQIDGKGRLSIPKKLRDLLTGTNGMEITLLKIDGCLQLYPQSMWTQVETAIDALSPFAERTRKLQRFWGMRSDQVVVDPEGRINLSPDQKEYAGIDRDVMIIGAINKVEIWNPERWEKVTGESPSLEELADEMANGT